MTIKSSSSLHLLSFDSKRDSRGQSRGTTTSSVRSTFDFKAASCLFVMQQKQKKKKKKKGLKSTKERLIFKNQYLEVSHQRANASQSCEKAADWDDREYSYSCLAWPFSSSAGRMR